MPLPSNTFFDLLILIKMSQLDPPVKQTSSSSHSDLPPSNQQWWIDQVPVLHLF